MTAAERPVVFKIQISRPIRYQNPATATSDIDLAALSVLPANGAILFHLHDLPQEKIDAWQQLYEQIKLSGVQVQWQSPGHQTNYVAQWSNGGTETNFFNPAHSQQMHWLLDPDDSTAEAAVLLRQYARCKTWRAGPRAQRTYFRPKIAQIVNASVNRPIGFPWVDTQDGDVYDMPSLCFKYAIGDSGTGVLDGNIQGNLVATTDPAGLIPFRESGRFVFTYYVTCRKTVPVTAT